MRVRSIKCPKTEDHCAIENGRLVSHQKTLLIVGEKSLYVYCKLHGWLKVEMLRGGRKISFEDITVTITDEPLGRTKNHIKTDNVPTMAIGKFKSKRSK